MPSDSSPVSSLNHFAAFGLERAYWELAEEERARLRVRWIEATSTIADVVHHYRTFPAHGRSDFLLWSAMEAGDPDVARTFFESFAGAIRPFRRFLRPADFFWGFTRPSQYSRARSRQEVDPFAEREEPYLVMYPFTKTAEWYLTGRQARQEMMNEHMRIGKQYQEITQLLLYSVGLQEQEFVVVYETRDLVEFSRLVGELRGTEARAFTAADTPVYVGVHRSTDEPAELWP